LEFTESGRKIPTSGTEGS